MLLIVIGAQFFCGMASVTANSRMIYAFSRDGAVPGHKWWHTINKRTRTPTNAIWLAAVLAWLLVAPAYWYGSIVAYYAVTAIGGDRALHRLRDPDVPAPAGEGGVQARPVDARERRADSSVGSRSSG